MMPGPTLVKKCSAAWIVKDLERGGLKGINNRDGRDVWLDYCIVDRCQGPTLPGRR